MFDPSNPLGSFDPDWHLQICHREYVVWWYGDAPDGCDKWAGHIDPAEHVIHLGEGIGDIRLPFKLPERYQGGQSPKERWRGIAWGYRFRSNGLIHDCGWHLAETREQALADAARWVETTSSIRNDDRDNWRRYLQDVHEYGNGLW